MTRTIDIPLPRLHSAQRQIVAEARRFNVGCMGRRFGKSTLAVRLGVRKALDGLPVAYFFPTYRMLAEVWRDLVGRLVMATRTKREQEHRIDLVTGGSIEMWSLTEPNVARGRKYARVLIDEAAMVPALEDAWQAVIRPTLADYAGDAWFFSTPKGQNFFADLYDRGQRLEGDWMSWRMPTHRNPYIAPAELAAMKDELPALVYAQEVLAEISESGLGLFRVEDINRAEVGALGEAERLAPRRYLTSVDVGRRHDATIINTFDASQTPYQRVAFERLERVSYPIIQQRIDARAREYPGETWVESNGIGDPTIENLETPVTPFITTARSKMQALESLQWLFERGYIKAKWDARERAALVKAAWDDDHTADEVMSLAIAASVLRHGAGWSVDSLKSLSSGKPV
jgi:hypothetical protein